MRRKSIFTKAAKLRTILASSPTLIYRSGRQSLGLLSPPELYYVVPAASWSTDWDGYYITSSITAQFGWRAHLTSAPHLLVDHIIHYGEPGTFLASIGSRRNRYNTIVATIFHGSRTSEFPELARSVERFVEHADVPARIVTACGIMEERLIGWGISSDKVVRIPLGVDLTRFKPVSQEVRLACRRRMGIPDDAICIGSFQKDGNGWEKGLTPKLIKGPDIFLRVIERLHKQYKLYVLLTAPARGYVKQGLEALGVPYRHEILSDYRAIAQMYHCLDLYLMASREEGGPKAVLESLASGVPLVSTSVGMAPDLIEHGHNGFLADSEDVDTLAEHLSLLIEQPELRRQVVANGLISIKPYDWRLIAARYYQELYYPLLKEHFLPPKGSGQV